MEFKEVAIWKQNELETVFERFQIFKKTLSEMLEQNSILVDKVNTRMSKPEDERIKIKQERDKYYKELTDFRRANSYYDYLYDKVCYSYLVRTSSEEAANNAIKVLIQKGIDKHFKELQAKVEKQIGKILKINHIGGYNYEFIGELGNCKVEVILAGGYNIQRLHTRWVIKK